MTCSIPVLRETYSLACTAPGCRWARLLIHSLDAAVAMARQHASPAHIVHLSSETRREVGRYGKTRRPA